MESLNVDIADRCNPRVRDVVPEKQGMYRT